MAPAPALANPFLDPCSGERCRSPSAARSHARELPRDADGDAGCWARPPNPLSITQAEEGAGERRDLESSLFVGTCGVALFSAGPGRTVGAVVCPRKAGRGHGIASEMPRYSTGQEVNWFDSGLRKLWISEVQHTPNLTLLPVTSFSLPLPSLSVLPEMSGFSLSTKALPHPSVSIPFGTGWFSCCTFWSTLMYPHFPKGF